MTSKALLGDSVDLNAGFYEKNSNLQGDLGREVLDGYQVDERSHVLDVGCGDGKRTAELASLAKEGRVLGIGI